MAELSSGLLFLLIPLLLFLSVSLIRRLLQKLLARRAAQSKQQNQEERSLDPISIEMDRKPTGSKKRERTPLPQQDDERETTVREGEDPLSRRLERLKGLKKAVVMAELLEKPRGLNPWEGR